MTVHQHAYAMCVHGTQWHAACANEAEYCPAPHFYFEALRTVACAYCGSTTHFPVDCHAPAWVRRAHVNRLPVKEF